MAQEYPGFLTDTIRAYVRGDKQISSSSNPSRDKKRFRERISGAKRDWALIQTSDQDWVHDQLLQSNRNLHDPRGLQAPMTEEAVTQNRQAAKAQADSVGLDADSLEGLFADMDGEIDQLKAEMDGGDGLSNDEMEANVQAMFQELFASCFVHTIDTMMDGWAGSVDKQEVVRGFIEGAWPDQQSVLDSAEKQLSED